MEAALQCLKQVLSGRKTPLNIIMKVLLTVVQDFLGYWAIGFGLMYGLDKLGIIGTNRFFCTRRYEKFTL
jgi:Amt family ammonium transporter